MSIQPILVIIHSISCRMLPSKGNESTFPNKGLGLFFTVAACIAIPIGETGLPVDVKQLSMEQSPRWAGRLEVLLFSKTAAISDKEGIFMVSRGASPWQSSVTLIASSESSSLAASSPADSAAWSWRALQAFSSIDCRYFPCASIRSCKWRCTCFEEKQ